MIVLYATVPLPLYNLCLDHREWGHGQAIHLDQTKSRLHLISLNITALVSLTSGLLDSSSRAQRVDSHRFS